MTDKKDNIGPLAMGDIDKAMLIFDEVISRLHRDHGGHHDDDRTRVHHDASIMVAASNITAAIVANG